MSRAAETILCHLKTLGETIEFALDSSLGCAHVSSSIFKFVEMSAELPEDTHADEKADAVEKAKSYTKRLAEIEMSCVAGNVPLPPTVNVTMPEKPRLPKEKPLSHDGEIESFRPFWMLFQKRVLSKVADKEMQHYLLCNAVSLADLNHIVGLDV